MSNDAWDIEVHDRESFQKFMGLLIADFKANGKDWENNSMELFLEAMERYSGDLDGYYLNNHPEVDADAPAWRAFADILRGAVVHE